MILSYHPILEGDENRLCAGRDPDEADLALLRRASAVILPQGCRESLYLAARRYCRHVFPNYGPRSLYPHKVGDVRLFRAHRLPHPESMVFSGVEHCSASFWSGLSYPVVLKSNFGGEGSLVFLVKQPGDAGEPLGMLAEMERSGFCGFVVQQWIQTDNRDLRVAILGDRFYSYWRVQPDHGRFLHNLSAGAEIDPDSDPHLQAAGVEYAREFQRRTGIDLAGIDLMFPLRGGRIGREPLFLEINYYFGRRGLGGSDRYYELLEDAVRDWLRRRGLR
jgi:ribosomal protein S6--L-glutamate ligase